MSAAISHDRIAAAPRVFVEWGEWECPVCREVVSDPEMITVTCCPNGHPVILGPVEERGFRWAETWGFDY